MIVEIWGMEDGTLSPRMLPAKRNNQENVKIINRRNCDDDQKVNAHMLIAAVRKTLQDGRTNIQITENSTWKPDEY